MAHIRKETMHTPRPDAVSRLIPHKAGTEYSVAVLSQERRGRVCRSHNAIQIRLGASLNGPQEWDFAQFASGYTP